MLRLITRLPLLTQPWLSVTWAKVDLHCHPERGCPRRSKGSVSFGAASHVPFLAHSAVTACSVHSQNWHLHRKQRRSISSTGTVHATLQRGPLRFQAMSRNGWRNGLARPAFQLQAEPPTGDNTVSCHRHCRQTVRAADLRFASAENELRFRHDLVQQSFRLAAPAGVFAKLKLRL